jgi:hypothetical protein
MRKMKVSEFLTLINKHVFILSLSKNINDTIIISAKR